MDDCHVVEMPYPGRGHINPMMSLCQLLASKKDQIRITFVVTEEWLGFFSSEPKPADNIHFATIPNVVPSEIGRAADFPAFYEATQIKLEEPFERLLDRLEPREPRVVIYDTELPWVAAVGNRRNIPVASFWTTPASMFTVLYHFDLLVQNGHFPVAVSEASIRKKKMEPMNNDPTKICHVVAVPYPGRGHINPMMNFCKLLALRKDEILITFVVTEEWLGFLGSEPKPANFRFATIPNVIPSEIGRSADFPGFIKAVLTKLEEPFERLLDQLEPPKPSVIIYDTYMLWVVGVGNRRNIPVASFWTMPAPVFTVLYHFDLLKQNGHFPVDFSERGNELVNYIPGIPPTRIADLPTIFYGNGLKTGHIACEAVSRVSNAQYLLFTSIYELESQAIDALKAVIPTPIYSIGPAIPYFRLEENSYDSQNRDTNYMQWLDSQPKSSVLYISQGSFLSVSRTQMDEIIAGVDMSGVRFLWVARGDASRIKEGCGDLANKGVVVPWCDQLKVLCHPSIGGFWTHCGWNSIKEGVFAGIPFLTYPIFWDQIPNSKTIVEDWKIGWKVRRGMGEEEHLVTREEIAGMVERFMDSESDQGNEIRRRAKELKEVCRRAVSKGGSAETAIDAFIHEISQCRDR